jgi:transposase
VESEHHLDRRPDAQLTPLVTFAAPELVALPGIGVDTAGQLLVTAGDNPQRLRSEQSSARLCGVAPVPVSSGRTDRNRPHRGGDRDANSALWRIALVRMHCHQPTKDYVARRTAEGRTKKEILRCLKRYIAREAYPLLLGYGSAHDPGLPRRLWRFTRPRGNPRPHRQPRDKHGNPGCELHRR